MGGKIEKPWLGVYIIQKYLGKGRYCLKTLEGKLVKQTIHCACLKRYLDPVVDDNIVDEVEELDNSDSECAENDNDKEQGCQNEELQSHSPEQREIMEPVFVLEEQLYSPNISRLWRSGACISYYEAKEDDEEFDNAELDLQQEEYALSKDIDVSLWIDFREFYGADHMPQLEQENRKSAEVVLKEVDIVVEAYIVAAE
eukprot:Em0003g1724a